MDSKFTKVNNTSFIKKSIVPFQLFVKTRVIFIDLCVEIQGLSFCELILYQLIFKFPHLFDFYEILCGPHKLGKSLAGQAFPLHHQTQSITTTLVVICDHLSGPHLQKLAPSNPPPTREWELTIGLTKYPVDPT